MIPRFPGLCSFRLLMPALLLGASLLLLAGSAQAATITVNNFAPDNGFTGDCTLREAIQAANTDTAVDGCAAGSGADTIVLPECRITLTAADHLDITDGPIGLPDITTVITIQGQGFSQSIIERDAMAPDFTIFRVAGAGDLTLTGIDLQGGRNAVGGGIITRARPLTLSNCQIGQHTATGPAGGGAIAAFGAAVVSITNCSFESNSSAAGPAGAIMNQGVLNIINATFSANTAATHGGAIEAFVGCVAPACSTTINSSSFFSNQAGDFGGALHIHDSMVTVSASSFIGNQAGSLAVPQGGGGAIEGDGTFRIMECQFDGNMATGSALATGGAIRVIDGDLQLSKSTLSNNSVSGTSSFGGAIILTGAPVQSAILVNNTISANRASSGGAIAVEGGTMILNNNTIAFNTAFTGILTGGGILLRNVPSATVQMRNNVVANNNAETGVDCFTEPTKTITSQGHNLVGIGNNCSISVDATDMIGNFAMPVEPRLDSVLRFRGGSGPLVHALLTGSPAIDTGDPATPGTGGTACEATDQIGTVRPVGMFCDRGAFEGVVAQANLLVTMTDTPDPVQIGNNVTFDITVMNQGPQTATGVTLSVILPASFTFVPGLSSTSCISGTPIFCNLGSLNMGQSTMVTVVATTSSAGTLTTLAQVFAFEEDTNFANNQALQATTVLQDGNLRITKTGTPDPVATGGSITYAITAENLGGANATNVVVTDTFSNPVTITSATSSVGTCTPTTGATTVVTCNVGTLGPQGITGDRAFIDITVTAPATPGTLMNTAMVTATEADPDTSNNSAMVTINVLGRADLAITKMDTPDPVALFGMLTYTLVVTNNGPDPATNVSVSDDLPPEVTLQTINNSAGTCDTGEGISCDIPTLAVAATATITIVVRADVVCDAFNSARVSVFSQIDANPANDMASAMTTVGPPAAAGTADLSVTKADAPDPVTQGNNLTYTIVVSNGGPDPASNVMLTDTLPGGVTFVSATPASGTCTGTTTVTCNLGTIFPGTPNAVTLVVTANAAGMITNTASATATETDPNTADNMATAMTQVTPVADVSVTKTDSPDPVAALTNLTYTVTVMNSGPSPATGVVLTDTLPSGVTFVSATAPCTQAGGVVTCNLGMLNSGASTNITIVVTPAAVAIPTVITNTATVSANEFDPDTANNTATQDTTVNVAMADVQVTKTDSPDPVAINTDLTYIITVRNNGPQTATNVVVNDTLPSGPTFVSANSTQGSCIQSAGIICTIGTMASGATVTVTIIVRPTTVGTVDNSVTVTAIEADPNPSNNMASTSTTVIMPTFDLTIPPGSPTSGTIVTGGTATFDFIADCQSTGQLIAFNGTTNAPASTISFMPPAVICNTVGPQPVTVVVQTVSCVWLPPAPRPNFPNLPIQMFGPWVLLLLLSLTWWFSQRRENAHVPAWQRALAAVALFVSLAGMTACAGNSARRGNPFGTPAGTYTVTVNATANGATRSLNFTVNVTLP